MKVTSIQNNAEHQAMLNRIDTIFSAQPGTPEGEDLMRLVKLVEKYEEARYAIPSPGENGGGAVAVAGVPRRPPHRRNSNSNYEVVGASGAGSVSESGSKSLCFVDTDSDPDTDADGFIPIFRIAGARLTSDLRREKMNHDY